MQELFVHLTERWDGKGRLGRSEGEGIPLPLRITHLAQGAALQRVLHGEEGAVEVVRARRGTAASAPAT